MAPVNHYFTSFNPHPFQLFRRLSGLCPAGFQESGGACGRNCGRGLRRVAACFAAVLRGRTERSTRAVSHACVRLFDCLPPAFRAPSHGLKPPCFALRAAVRMAHMLIVRRVLIAVFVLAAAVFAWLWWTRPVKVDMAAYVPADSIVYFEAGSLKEITNAVTSTDDWRELAPAAGAQADASRRGWLTDFLSFTGAGPSDAVVLARAQVAVTVLGFDAAEESGETLKYTPRAALVAETQASEWRVKSAVEKLVGDFARRSLGASGFERKEVEGATFYVWSAPSGERKRIVAAVSESVAVVGNDEGAVRSCLGGRRAPRPSLASNEELKEMRARLRAETALAFGFAPQGSAAKVVEFFAPGFVGCISQKANVQIVLATVLPQLINQTIGNAGWSARVAGGRIEDD